MSFELRLLIVCFAAFAAAGAVGAAIALWLSRRPLHGRAIDRATRVLEIRLLPLACALAASALAAIAFFLFEPRSSHEAFGWTLTSAAAFGALLIGVTGARAIRITRETRRITREWMATAEPISISGIDVPAFAIVTPFPVVAVVGLVRPRLVIARSVLDACSADEVRAIVSHERHHLQRRDNLRRALIALAPDVLGLLPASRRLLRAWHEATEDAADDFARRTTDAAGVALAGALLKVARLAPNGTFVSSLPASALYRGENLERRVRRLLQPHFDAAPAPRAGRLATLMAVAAVLALSTLERVHHAMEAIVNSLP